MQQRREILGQVRTQRRQDAVGPKEETGKQVVQRPTGTFAFSVPSCELSPGSVCLLHSREPRDILALTQFLGSQSPSGHLAYIQVSLYLCILSHRVNKGMPCVM